MASGWDFTDPFTHLTGHSPFPWQAELYRLFEAGDFASCGTCCLPTGLGKTSIIALWLIALSRQPTRVPRRLAYVVNRRTVVDQTTSEVEKYRQRLLDPHAPPPIAQLRESLTALCAFTLGSTLKLSTGDDDGWSPLANGLIATHLKLELSQEFVRSMLR